MARIKPADWYRTRIVGVDVTHIDEPHVKTFYHCYIWHVRGRTRDMIVDGVTVAQIHHDLRRQMALDYLGAKSEKC